MRRKSVCLFGLGLVMAMTLAVTLKTEKVNAAPVCYNSSNAASAGPGSAFPRNGMAKNATPGGGCGDVPGATRPTGNPATDTDGMQVYLSSYYWENSNNHSALHTPNAFFKLYSSTTERPVGTQTVQVRVYWCRGGSTSSALVRKGGSLIGSGTRNVSFNPTEFEAIGNMWQTSSDIRVSLNNDALSSQDGICKISLHVTAGSARISFSGDTNPTSSATNGAPNRYNQNYINNNPPNARRATLGPAGPGAFALRTDFPNTYSFEYALTFRPDCSITEARTIFLKVYDPDSPDGRNPAGTTNNSTHNGDRYSRMGVYEYNASGGFVGFINPTGDPDYRIHAGNDDFVQYGLTVRPGYKYAWVIWNVSARNGIQVLMPFSEVTATDGFECASPKASTCNYRAYSIGVLNPNSGQYEYNSYTELADDAQFNARQGQRVRVRMRMVNEGTNVWTRGGTSGYGLAQNAAYPTEGTYNEIPGPTYLDWQENDPEDNSAPTTTKARNDLANFYYDFIVPDWSSAPANNVKAVSYKMHQRGTGGGFFGGACRWKVSVGRPVAAPRCSMVVSILGSAFAFVQPGGSISLTVTISNAGGTNAESFDGNGWPFTLDPDTIEGAQETITNYGTVSAFTQPNIPAVNRTVTRTYVVNRPTGVYEIAGYLRQGTTNNWIPCTNVAPTTTPPPNCVLSAPDCCPAATPAQAAYCVPVNVSTVPYLRSYGGDVIAGSGLRAGGSCQATPTGAINTYIDRDASNRLIGSGTQMAAFALGTVNGFRTDTQNVNSRPQSRVFANRAYANNNYGAGVATTQVFGGNYGGSLCADDWAAPTAGVATLPSSTVNMASLASGMYRYSGNVNLSGVNVTGRKTLFINGNVTITADTTYSGAWAGVTNIPNVVIVANNIYIHPDVTSVDAYLVARNTLWTCYDPNNIAAGVTTAGVRTSCLGRHLTVNGALLAGKINFWRMGGTIRNSTAGETFADSAARAGETVRLSPEFLISQQAGPSQNGSTGGLDRTYDSITNLSPTF